MIVDASVAFKWIFPEEGSDAAIALVGRDDLRAPALLLVEIGNAIWKKFARGELRDREAYATQLGLVASLVTFADDADLAPRALEIATLLDHPIYDCLYLALAEREGEPVVTADARFARNVAGSDFAALLVGLSA